MPDILIFIVCSATLFIFTLIGLIENNKGFIGSIISVLLIIWASIAHANAEKHLKFTTKVVVIDNTAYIKYDNRMYNINSMFDRNIHDGTEVKVFKYDLLKYGILLVTKGSPIFELSE